MFPFPHGYKVEGQEQEHNQEGDAWPAVQGEHGAAEVTRTNTPHERGHSSLFDSNEPTPVVEYNTGAATEKEGKEDGHGNEDYFSRKHTPHVDAPASPDRDSYENIYESSPATPNAHDVDEKDVGADLTPVISQRSVRSNASGRSWAEIRKTGSRDAEGIYYPEGGRDAYFVVFGAWCALFGALGLCNTAGTFQAYLVNNQLADRSDGDIGWIFGLYAGFMFFTALPIGPIFDAKGPRVLLCLGTLLTVLGLVVLGWCTKYWHFMLVYPLMIGLGNSLVFTPTVATIGHYFNIYRARATGLATCAGGFGGVVFPMMLQSLFPKVGWAWATRAAALVCLVVMGIGCCFVKGRLPTKPASKKTMLPDFSIFLKPVFAISTAGVFFLEWGMFIPVTYISSYALDHGVREGFSYQMLALLNAGSAFGRFIPGFIADKIGRYNTMIITAIMCFLTNFVFWLPAGSSTAMIVVFAVAFGFASGSNISLVPVCIGQVCEVENYGRYYAAAYSMVSFAVLTGVPIGGQIVSRCGGDYWGLILFTGLSYVVATICFIVAKLLHCGLDRKWAIW